MKTPLKKSTTHYRKMERDEHIWQAVAAMEQSFYTRDEIAETLREVAGKVETVNAWGETIDREIYGER